MVALDHKVLVLLQEQGIAAYALTDLSQSPDGDRELLERIRALALRWYTVPQMQFFEYDGIKLGEQYEVVVLYYLEALVYYVSVLSQMLGHFPALKEIIIPETSVQVPPTADPTARFKESLPVDVVRLLAESRGIQVVIVPALLSLRTRGRIAAMRRKTTELLVRTAVVLLNTAVTYTGRRRAIRLFATDPWSRIEPFIKDMPDVELVMSRRVEAKAMGLSAIWRARARFHHRLDFADRSVRSLAAKKAEYFAREWDALGPALSLEFVYKDISFWPVAKQVFDSIVKQHSADAVATIENTKRLFVRHDINCVLLFASTKGYNLVIARVAENLDIPSIELQHALVNDDKTLVHCRLNSRYLASYGAFTNRMYESWGVESWRLVSCGSPRFDTYARPNEAAQQALRQKLALATPDLVVLYNIPQIYLTLEYGNYTSWEVSSYIADLAQAAKKLPHARFLLRPKPGAWSMSFYKRPETEEFFDKAQLVQQDSLQTLFSVSNIVVSSSSTMVLEAMLAHRPVIMYIPKLLDHDFDLFAQAGAVLMARTPQELAQHLDFLKDEEHRRAQIARADAFVEDSFNIDGGSAGRVAALIRRVTAGAESSTMPV